MNRTQANKFSIAYDTVDSMQYEDIKKIAIEKIIHDMNVKEKKKIAKQKKKIHEPQYHFTKAYKIPLRRLVMDRTLTTAEKAFLFDMIPFVNRETNILVDERGFPMGQQKLMDICNFKRTKLHEVTNGLINKSILFAEHENGRVYYRMNQEYFECRRKEVF